MNIHKIISFLLLILVSITACEKSFLDPQGDNLRSKEFMLSHPDYAEGILLTAYKQLPTSYSPFTEVATDDAVTNDKASTLMRMATGEWSALFTFVSVWSDAYTAIYHTNLILSLVNDVEWSWQSPVRNEMFIKKIKGEAFGMRACFYLDLLKKHGGVASNGQLLGVPLITKPLGSADVWKLPRATFQEVLDQINKDLDSAIIMLPYKWANTYTNADSLRVFGVKNTGRLQGQIAAALKSQAAMLDASPAYNNGSYDPDKCLTAASLAGPILVKFGGTAAISTAANRRFFWDDDDDATANTDIMWRQNYANSNTLERDLYPPSQYGRGRVNPTHNFVNAFPMKNGYPIDSLTLSLFDPLAPYANRDPRLDGIIVRNGGTVRAGATINTTPASTTVDGLNKTINSTRTGYYQKKFLRVTVNIDPAVTATSIRHFYTHIRFTELFLNYAEMMNEATGGGPDADPNGYGFTPRSILARIRVRAGITPTTDPYLASLNQDGIRQLIRNERRIELSFEGHRFWDLRRWQADLSEDAMGVSIVGTDHTPFPVEDRIFPTPASYYGPIPKREIVANDLLIQNTGW